MCEDSLPHAKLKLVHEIWHEHAKGIKSFIHSCHTRRERVLDADVNIVLLADKRLRTSTGTHDSVLKTVCRADDATARPVLKMRLRAIEMAPSRVAVNERECARRKKSCVVPMSQMNGFFIKHRGQGQRPNALIPARRALRLALASV
jgi:hypothetical protein